MTMFSSSMRLTLSGCYQIRTLKSPVNSPSVFTSVPKFVSSESNSRFVAMSSVEKTLSDSGGIDNRASRIREKLQKELEPVELVIEDVSYQHAGHAGFQGMNMVKRHRLVYDFLREELDTGLHALSIVSKTPSESPP